MIYKVKKVNHPHDIVTSVPGSKSITNRALLIAALASGRSVLKGCLFSDDSRHFIDALIRLGFPVLVDEDKREITITGFGGRIPKNEAEIDVGSAGTAARFLTALLGLSKGRYHIVSSEQMKKRPMKDLLVSLEKLGAHIEYDENEYHFPFTIGNTGEYADTVDINVDKSSQFLSALLISAIVMEKTFTINVTGTHGMAYVEMTRLMMKQFGLDVMQDKKNNSFIIPKKAAYESLDYDIEPDVSAACSTSAGAVNYMRTTMGFNGLLITDDLSDASLNKVYTQDEAAVAAVKAGMSMLYVSTGFESSYNAVLSAVNSGEIPAEKLDDAVGRILTTKGI